MLPGSNLAEVEPILVVSSNDEVPLVPKVVQVPQGFREKVEHSYNRGECVNSRSEVEMPPKLMKVRDLKPIQEK